MKVILILVDGMRPDSLSGVKYVKEFMKKSTYTLNAKTVMPSVTLPCHMSLFHSVTPMRHGITTNTYMPQVRPIAGLCEKLKEKKLRSAFFYNWEQLRDLARPGSLSDGYYASMGAYGFKESNNMVADAALKHIKTTQTDFTFLYLGEVDEVGHGFGWMTPEYLDAVQRSWDWIEKIISELPEDYSVIVTADHGGHDRTHGSEMPEDMTTPIFLYGKPFEAGKEIENAQIIDIAPTIVKLLGAETAVEWEGKSLL